MINFMIYCFYMFLISLICFMLSMFFYFYDYSIMMEWLMYSINSVNLEFFILLDWISLLFISLVMLISSMIFMYSSMYMENDKFIDRFMILVILFIMSMVFMIISPNIFSILFGWDGLGLVSYCLVIYYQNYTSYNSGMVTVLCNRVGDIGLLMSIGLMIMYGSWNIYMLTKSSFMVMILLILAALTKSAQIPFSSWLPMAMAAPTPVSALVHSSTLVTAGVYLMIRFNSLLMMMEFNFMLLLISVLTLFMAGLMANVEFDLKKIIALSTLSQLGMMMMILSLGFSLISFYHLLVHAIFKSLLFMCAGVMIHLMNNNQDIRNYGCLNEFIPFIMMSFYISSMSLCGFPFLAGFYSKDLIMEIMYLNKVNLFLMFMIIMSLTLTVSYSFRLFYYMFFGSMKFFSFMNIKENKIMNISMMMLMMLSMLIGSMLMWLFMFDFYIPLLSIKIKMLTLIMCLLGIFIGVILCLLYTLKMYMYMYFFSSMWFLNYFMLIIYKPIMIFSNMFYMIDKIWVEYTGRLMMMNYLLEYSKFVNMNYKIFMFMNLLVFFIWGVYLYI
uniref:NADH dehydrogenase subunit 5 n=1 Tax=Tapinoma ibericum TaxID=2005328 RepID=UPI0021769B8E|nr:NADH dehydrogenase subunit 5 [Tapinoma ibericum]UUF93599.1 NADH dehydrogenase subunit 5 [Tapinoma ibericum]